MEYFISKKKKIFGEKFGIKIVFSLILIYLKHN